MGNKPYDEMYPGDGAARAHYQRYAHWFAAQPAERLAQKRAEALLKELEGFERLTATQAPYTVDHIAGISAELTDLTPGRAPMASVILVARSTVWAAEYRLSAGEIEKTMR